MGPRLVGGWTNLFDKISNGIISPGIGVKIPKKCLKPPPSQGPGTHEKIPIQKNKMMNPFFTDTCQHTEPYESVSTFKPSTKVAPTT